MDLRVGPSTLWDFASKQTDSKFWLQHFTEPEYDFLQANVLCNQQAFEVCFLSIFLLRSWCYGFATMRLRLSKVLCFVHTLKPKTRPLTVVFQAYVGAKDNSDSVMLVASNETFVEDANTKVKGESGSKRLKTSRASIKVDFFAGCACVAQRSPSQTESSEQALEEAQFRNSALLKLRLRGAFLWVVCRVSLD